MDDVARRLAALLSRAPAQRPDVRAFVPAVAPERVAAIDGSNVVLAESGSLLVGAFRAAAILMEHGRALPVGRHAPEVCLLSDAEAAKTLSARCGGRDVAPLHAKACLEALRSHAELTLAQELLEKLDAGDALLLDGSLAVRPPILLLEAVVKRAAERGVDVIGVCKSTSMTLGAAPALAACQLAARASPSATWSVEMQALPNVRGRVLIARLSRAEERPFRFDIATSGDPNAVLARLAGLAGHPAYPGYPSPLAMAHHAAVITDQERRRLAADIMERVASLGVRGDAWRAAFVDYHEMLELGV